MGHRANFAIVQDGRTRLYYSSWAALTMAQALFLGPEFALSWIEDMELTDGLMGHVSCDGAAVLDRDARQLFFYISYTPFHLGIRCHLLPMMALNWPGWEIGWADQGLIDIALRLGIDPSLVRDEIEGDFLRSDKADVQMPEFGEGLITLGRSNGARDYRVEFTLWALAWGPELIDLLQGPGFSTLVEDEELCNGAFLDPNLKEMWVWWSTNEDDRTVERITKLWPGWTVRRHNEGLRKHVELSGRDSSGIGMGQEEAIHRIAAILAEDNSFDPGKLLDAIQKDRGETDVQVGRGFLRSDRPEIDPSSKRAIIERTIAAYMMDPAGQ